MFTLRNFLGCRGRTDSFADAKKNKGLTFYKFKNKLSCQSEEFK